MYMVGAEEEAPWGYADTGDICSETASWQSACSWCCSPRSNTRAPIGKHQQELNKLLVVSALRRASGASGGIKKGEHPCLDSKGSREEKKNIRMLY